MRKLSYLLGLIICALCITYPIQGYATEATEEQALDITAEAAEELVLDTSDSQGTVILYGADSETFERDKYDTLVSVQVKNWTLINNVFTYGCLADRGNNQTLKQLCYAMYNVHIKAKDYFAK